MQINKIQVNQFGKIEDKKIELKKFNLIYGKNESGKSTLLDFILSMYYGISKNKNGKSYSDYDQYKPWNEKDFSGKMSYTLDSGKEINVYRNFNKKNPELTDENGKDISKEFDIDKTKGNQFFVEQTGVDENIINSTVITMQKETELDQSTQNILLQKIANLAESGNEEVSYKTAMNKLDRILLNEVGTSKSSERPINIVNENISKIENELEEINSYKSFENEYQEKKNNIQKQIQEENENKEIYQEINEIIDQDRIEKENINVKEKILEENKAKISKLEQTEKEEQNKTNEEVKKQKRNNTIIFSTLVLIFVLCIAFIKNKIISILPLAIAIIYAIFAIQKNKKKDTVKISNEKEILLNNSKSLEDEIAKLKQELIEKDNNKKQELISKYGENIKDLFTSEIREIIKDNEENLKKLELENYKLELDKKNVEPKLEKILELEEELEIEKRTREELLEKARIFNLTKELMEESYAEMKSNITPKFNQNLSKNIQKFSNGKYNKITISDGIKVELENGEQKNIDKLSIGTIEQIYLALRLSVIDEISNEKLPVILDEPFAYFDDERLKQTIEYLHSIDNQVIILSCTQREKKILEETKEEYNYIEL